MPQKAIDDTESKTKLNKTIGLKDATIYGVGVILGAGIYALLGEASGIAGNATWISFVIGAIIAAFTVFSYAELSSIFPRAAAEFVYVKNSTKSFFLAFIVEYIVFLSLIFSAAAVAFGFGGYLNSLIGVNILYTAAVAIILLSVLNFKGIKESARFNIISTVVEAGGLVLIIILGLSFVGSVDYFAVPNGATDLGELFIPIFGATVLVFFAYQGFEELANLTEETKDAKKNIPKAMLLALGITTILYILVSIVAVSVVNYAELAESSAPLATVAEKAGGPGMGSLLGVIALFATANTVLVLLIAASRMLYGMASQGVLPKIFSEVHEKTKTPIFSIVFSAIAAIIFLIFVNDLSDLAMLTNMAIFLSFFSVNASLILIRFSKTKYEAGFRAPFNIGKLPITAVLGCLSSLIMLPQLLAPMNVLGIELPIILFGGMIMILGIPIYYFGKTKQTSPISAK
ncbi:MAG: APC family permease [archaeon]|nr:APC family permease [archaeon]